MNSSQEPEQEPKGVDGRRRTGNPQMIPPPSRPLLPPPPLAAVSAAIGVSDASQQQQRQQQQQQQRQQQQHMSRGGNSLSPSILIVTGLMAFVIVTSVSIHLLLRFLSRRCHPRHDRSLSTSATSSISTSTLFSAHLPPSPQDPNQKSLVDSLPLFSLASALAAVPKSSPDCAVCLSKFDPHDQLRLLPVCRHAFHAYCVDTWLRSTPSCPLCRSSVLPLPHAPPNLNPNASRSDSFQLEIGSVSQRREQSEQHHTGRTYSLGSSFEYVVDEEIEAVVAAVAAHVRSSSKESVAEARAPGEEVAGMVGGSGASWLKEYIDRLATSASSSFSSMRFSGRWSRRSDGVSGDAATGTAVDGGGSRDSEGNDVGEDLSAYYSFYGWLVGP